MCGRAYRGGAVAARLVASAARADDRAWTARVSPDLTARVGTARASAGRAAGATGTARAGADRADRPCGAAAGEAGRDSTISFGGGALGFQG